MRQGEGSAVPTDKDRVTVVFRRQNIIFSFFIRCIIMAIEGALRLRN